MRSGHCSTSRSNSCMQSWMLGHAIAERGSGSSGRKLDATRRVAVGVAAAGVGGDQCANARWYASFASANRSDMCSARASLNSTSAIVLALAATLEQRQQVAVVRDRLVEGVLLSRPVARERQVADRLVLVLGAEPVVGEQRPRPRARARPPCSSSHSAARRCRRSRSSRDERAVRGLLDQRVLEPVLRLGPAAAFAQQVEAHAAR